MSRQGITITNIAVCLLVFSSYVIAQPKQTNDSDQGRILPGSISCSGIRSPEVDQTMPTVSAVRVSNDAMSAEIDMEGLFQGHLHDFFLPDMRSIGQDKLLHAIACYTLNEIPKADTQDEAEAEHPDESKPWLHYEGGNGPGRGKHVVLIAAEQEYRSEQSMPMLARVLAKHHGFDCTVLFSVNENGEVDPTLPAPFKDSEKRHNIPGLEKLADADCLIWMSRFMHLPDNQMKHFHDYFDSGKPIIALRTANHGFQHGKKYVVNQRPVSLREFLGGAFSGHHGGWHRESTRGIVVDSQKAHPILTGVRDIWGTSDVYRCHTEAHPFPADCTSLVLGQPLINLNPDAPPNAKKEPLPIAWTKTWKGNAGRSSRIFHFTMGSAEDFANEGVRRLTVNAVYWGIEMETKITANRSVEIVGDYKPLVAGFNYEKLGVKPRKPEYFK